MNTLPPFSDRSEGIWRRLILIPFSKVFSGTPEDIPDFGNILESELPGILNWAIEGRAKLIALGHFPECPEGKALKEKHRCECDPERKFLTEEVESATGKEIGSEELYRKFCNWADFKGYNRCSYGKFDSAVKRQYKEAVKERKKVIGQQLTFWQNINWVTVN